MKLHDAGVDWLTMTWTVEEQKAVPAWKLIMGEMSARASESSDVVPWRWNGYNGWQQGKICIGERFDGFCCRVSGRDARDIAKLLKGANLGGKVTRIDFQATAKADSAEQDHLQSVCKKVQYAVSGKQGIPARNTASYFHRGRSCGMVVGSRSSQSYLRIYDKTLEQSNRVEKGLIRYEAELKGFKARQAWAMYENSAQPYFLAVSLTKAEFEIVGANMDWLNAVEQVEFVSQYVGSDKEKKLGWLAKFVAPTVKWLIDRGHEEAVYDALGLDKHWKPDRLG